MAAYYVLARVLLYALAPRSRVLALVARRPLVIFPFYYIFNLRCNGNNCHAFCYEML